MLMPISFSYKVRCKVEGRQNSMGVVFSVYGSCEPSQHGRLAQACPVFERL